MTAAEIFHDLEPLGYLAGFVLTTFAAFDAWRALIRPPEDRGYWRAAWWTFAAAYFLLRTIALLLDGRWTP